VSKAAAKLATWDDIAHLPEKSRVEILSGELIGSQSPLPRHQHIVGGLLLGIGAPFHYGDGGPRGWWILADVDAELSPHDVVKPDVAGIRPFDAVELHVTRLFPPETAAEFASRLAEEAFRYDVAR
jgi:hypothetical protein